MNQQGMETVPRSRAGGGETAAARGPSSVPPVRAVERAAAILKAFTPPRPRLALTEIATAVELDKGTTRRLLLTLVESGLVSFDPSRKSYALALGLLEIASAVPDQRDLRAAARPILSELAVATRMTAFLSIVRDGRALCLERVNGMPDLEIKWWTVGGLIPLNCGGGPRVLLAHLPEAEFEAVIGEKVETRTPSTEIDPQRLRASRERIRANGYEIAVDDFVAGLSGIGVPVYGSDGAVVAALSLSGLTPSVISGDGEPPALAKLLEAVTRLSRFARMM